MGGAEGGECQRYGHTAGLQGGEQECHWWEVQSQCVLGGSVTILLLPAEPGGLCFRPQAEGIGEQSVFNSIFTHFALPKRCFQLCVYAALSVLQTRPAPIPAPQPGFTLI